jgi:hypothetical protein
MMDVYEWATVIGLFTLSISTSGALTAWVWSNLGKRIDAKADKELKETLDKKVDALLCEERHAALAAAVDLRIKEMLKMQETLSELTKSVNRMELCLAKIATKMDIPIPLDA